MLTTFLTAAFAVLGLTAAALPVPFPQDPPAAAAPATPATPLDEGARLNRLVELAALLQDTQLEAAPLATEAVRLAGFTIWDEDRTPLAEPLGAPRLGLAITDAELRAYSTMLRDGQRVQRDDLIAGIDVLYQQLGAEGSVRAFVLDWLRRGADSGNPSVRALTALLQALGNQHGGEAGRLDGDADVELDPLQALLMLRVLTEDLNTPLRRAIGRGEFAADAQTGTEKKKGPAVPAADGAWFEEPPGWAEDAYAGGITGLFGEVAGKIGEWGKSVSDGLGKANALMSIAKFIATYTFLRGEVTVALPGQPLVRTKDADPGEQRTLVARFWIDGTRVTDWLKEHRKLVALAGLDVDMPKTGPLKGIETEWDIKQSHVTTKTHLIQTVRGTPDISKIKSDENGEARITVEGCPQPVPLDPKKVMPLTKIVPIVVTPQVKGTEMQQDLVDAVTGAIGIKGGPSGWLTPVMEVLYRMKWKGGVHFDLHVLDWQSGESIGQGEITIRADGHRYTRTTAHTMSIARSLKFTDVQMTVVGAEPPPPLDPAVLKMMPATYREQMEKGFQQMAELARQRAFYSSAPGQAEMHLQDREFSRGEGDGCVDANEETRTTRDGDATTVFGSEEAVISGCSFLVNCDLEQRTATLQLRMMTKVHEVTRIKNGARETQIESDGSMSIFDGLTLLPPFDKGIVIPLQETEIREMDACNYYGVVRVPFRFGPGDRYQGTALVSYSVTRKVTPKKEPKRPR